MRYSTFEIEGKKFRACVCSGKSCIRLETKSKAIYGYSHKLRLKNKIETNIPEEDRWFFIPDYKELEDREPTDEEIIEFIKKEFDL